MPNSFRHLDTKVLMHISVGILNQVQDDGKKFRICDWSSLSVVEGAASNGLRKSSTKKL
jgi:hypothetical protein